ncbi:MAG: small multi-drug export protein [Thermoplasmata archaeon]
MYESTKFSIRELTLRQLLRGVLTAMVPLTIAAIYLLYIYTLGDVGKTLLPLLAAYFFPPFGKESVIPLGVTLGIHPALMAISIALVDIIVGLFLLWNYRILYYVPLLGKWARKTELKAKKMIEEGKGFSKLAFLGLILFVIVPFQGSGAIGATIIGKMSGVDAKKVLMAIVIGALAGTFMIAYSFTLILTAFRSDLLMGIVIVAAVAAIIVFLYHQFRRMPESDESLKQIREFSLFATKGGTEVESVEEQV